MHAGMQDVLRGVVQHRVQVFAQSHFFGIFATEQGIALHVREGALLSQAASLVPLVRHPDLSDEGQRRIGQHFPQRQRIGVRRRVQAGQNARKGPCRGFLQRHHPHLPGVACFRVRPEMPAALAVFRRHRQQLPAHGQVRVVAAIVPPEGMQQSRHFPVDASAIEARVPKFRGAEHRLAQIQQVVEFSHVRLQRHLQLVVELLEQLRLRARQGHRPMAYSRCCNRCRHAYPDQGDAVLEPVAPCPVDVRQALLDGGLLELVEVVFVSRFDPSSKIGPCLHLVGRTQMKDRLHYDAGLYALE